MKNIDPEARLLPPAPPAPSMPPGLVELMEDLSRSVLRNDPEDIFAFCAEHMRKLLVIRDGEEIEPKTDKKPKRINVANVLAATHKKAEKRRATFDRLLTESAHELDSVQAEPEIVLVNEDSDKSKGDILKSVDPLLPETEQQTLGFNNRQVEEEKGEDTKRHDFEQTETAISTIDEQSLNESDNIIDNTKSVQKQVENEQHVAINNDEGEKHIECDDETQIIIIDQEKDLMENNEDISDQKTKDHEELEEVKRTVSDAIAEIESAAIKTVTDITLQLGKNIQSNSVGSEVLLQDHLVKKVPTDLSNGDNSQYINASELHNPKNEINVAEKVASTDVQEQTLNEIKAAAIFVTALEEMTHNLDANKPMVEINKGRLTMVLEEPQEGIEATSDKNNENSNQAMLAQEEIHVQKHISELTDMTEKISQVPQTNDFQNAEKNATDTKNEPLSIHDDSLGDNNIYKNSNLNTEQKEIIDNSIIVGSDSDRVIKQENIEDFDVTKENIDSGHVQPIITKATNNMSNEEKINNKDVAVEKVENHLNTSEGVIAISDISETDKEPEEKPKNSELVITDTPTQHVAVSNEPLNEIIITVAENKPNSIDSINNGEEDGANNDIAIDLSNSERSPSSLKSNDSGDTDNVTNGISAEADNSIDNSENSANTTMDLETAAVTIQKVFRSFLFKSRASTIDDETPLDIPYLPDAIQDGEIVAEVEEDDLRVTNKERRNMGLSRMDTVLQTVNEEKSLSLSDDSSTLSSAATVIQAHVRGYFVRNKLSKTASNSKSNTHSSELDDQQKNKTVLNIHIVPEGSHFMSRDESLTLSQDLPLDTSPPSLTSYHSLGYDITERRKLLRREDAIQSSISPPSTNSGKSLDISVTTNDIIGQPEIEDDHGTDDKSETEEVKGSEISGDTTPTVSTTDTVIEVIKEIEPYLESKESEINLNSNEFEETSTTSQDKNEPSEPQPAEYLGVMHSGEFHDVVLLPQPTQLSRDDPKHVAREFKANLVYFLIWN